MLEVQELQAQMGSPWSPPVRRRPRPGTPKSKAVLSRREGSGIGALPFVLGVLPPSFPDRNHRSEKRRGYFAEKGRRAEQSVARALRAASPASRGTWRCSKCAGERQFDAAGTESPLSREGQGNGRFIFSLAAAVSARREESSRRGRHRDLGRHCQTECAAVGPHCRRRNKDSGAARDSSSGGL